MSIERLENQVRGGPLAAPLIGNNAAG